MDIIGRLPNPGSLHLVDIFLIQNSGSKRLLDSRNLFFFKHPQTLVIGPARTLDQFRSFCCSSFVGYSRIFILFFAGSFSFSLFLFLFFSLGSDTRCREFCFSAIFCCTRSMMLGDKDDGDSEEFICKLLV
jgi:hypothetical protein